MKLANLDLLIPTPQPEPTETKRWATVTSASPLRVRRDTETATLPVPVIDLVGGLEVGDRVWTTLHTDGQVYITGRLGGPRGHAWQDYAPTLTNVTLGAGGSVGGVWHYVARGEISGYINLRLGTGGRFNGAPLFGLPVPTTGNYAGTGTARDDSTGARRALIIVASTAAAFSLVETATNAWVTATAPWTWAEGDSIAINFTGRTNE